MPHNPKSGTKRLVAKREGRQCFETLEVVVVLPGGVAMTSIFRFRQCSTISWQLRVHRCLRSAGALQSARTPSLVQPHAVRLYVVRCAAPAERQSGVREHTCTGASLANAKKYVSGSMPRSGYTSTSSFSCDTALLAECRSRGAFCPGPPHAPWVQQQLETDKLCLKLGIEECAHCASQEQRASRLCG